MSREEVTSKAIDRVDAFLRSGAICEIVLNYDQEYNLVVKPIPSATISQSFIDKVHGLIPAGSRWSQLLGWHSYTGKPFKLDQKQYLALGVETVFEHETRGAYVAYKAYIFDFPLPQVCIDNLLSLAEDISEKNEFVNDEIKSFRGVILGRGNAPSEHQRTESWIIREAVTYYERNLLAAFRTLALLEEQLPFQHKNDFRELVAIIPPISATFSEITQKKLRESELNFFLRLIEILKSAVRSFKIVLQRD